MKKLGIVLLVLLALLVGADRLADWGAQRVIASSLQDSQGLSESPDVDVTGFPFLTQLAGGSFDEVTVGVDSYPLAGGVLKLRDIDLTFRDVSRSGGTVEAGRVAGEGVLRYGDLGEVLGGIEIGYSADGGVSISGQPIDTGIRPVLADGAIGFALPGSDQPIPGLKVPIGGLPFSVSAGSLSAERDGLHLRLSGRDLSYRG